MDWTGAIGLVGAIVGATGTTWAIVSDRSRMRTLERSAELMGKLSDGSDAKSSVSALMDDMTADMLRAYRNPSNSRWPFLGGLALTLLGVAGGVALFTRPVDSGFGVSTGLGFALAAMSAGLFASGYALVFLALINRRRHRYRQRNLEELEAERSRIQDMIKHHPWNLHRRYRLQSWLQEIEANIKATKNRSRR